MVSYDRRWDLLRDTEASFCRCNVATAAAVGSQPVPGLKADGFDQDALPDVLDEARWMGYDPNDTLNDMLRLTKGDNPCLECHAVEEREPGEPAPRPRHSARWGRGRTL